MKRITQMLAVAVLAAVAMSGTAHAYAPYPVGIESVVEVRSSVTGQVCGNLAVVNNEPVGGCVVRDLVIDGHGSASATNFHCDPIEIGRLHVGGNGELAAAEIDMGDCPGVPARHCHTAQSSSVLHASPWSGKLFTVGTYLEHGLYMATCTDYDMGANGSYETRHLDGFSAEVLAWGQDDYFAFDTQITHSEIANPGYGMYVGDGETPSSPSAETLEIDWQ